MKKISLHKKGGKFYISIDNEDHHIGDYDDGPTVNLDELLETLHENGVIEYRGIFLGEG